MKKDFQHSLPFAIWAGAMILMSVWSAFNEAFDEATWYLAWVILVQTVK
jgi:hypothetical protein